MCQIFHESRMVVISLQQLKIFQSVKSIGIIELIPIIRHSIIKRATAVSVISVTDVISVAILNILKLGMYQMKGRNMIYMSYKENNKQI